MKGWVEAQNAPPTQPKDCSPALSAFYKTFDSLFVHNGVLYRNWIDDTGIKRSQIVIPKFFLEKILHQIHNQIGHFGIHKTFDMLQKRFYWPGFHNDVENFCKSCEICIKNKVIPRPRKLLKPIEVLPIPFYMVGIDVIGPLKTTTHRNPGADPAKNFMGAENVGRKTTPFLGHAFTPKREMINAISTLKMPLFISKDENITF